VKDFTALDDKLKIFNISGGIPEEKEYEFLEEILCSKAVRIERIVSRGHSSPPGFWYDQTENEWVLLFSGRARIAFETDDEVELQPGDHLLIPAGLKHRVVWTDPDIDTIWLAVFFS